MLCLIVMLCSGAQARAQWLVTADLAVALPRGAFKDVADPGTGVSLKGQYRLRGWPALSLKADVAFITYQYALYSEFGYPIESRTQSVRLTMGPQLSVRRGSVEAYLCPMVGLYNFAINENIASTSLSRTRNSNTEFGWNLSGGVMIIISRRPKRSFDLALDTGLSWHWVSNGVRMENEDELVECDVRELGMQAGIVFLLR